MTRVYEYNNKTYIEYKDTTLQVSESKKEVETNIQKYIDLIEKIKEMI